MDAQNPTVLVVAHRGAWHFAPENSLPAIRWAMDLGVDMVEVDVRKNADGGFILMHDETVDRTTNGTGRIAEMTLIELQRLRLKDNTGKITTEKIPLLEDILKLIRGKVMINLDMAYDVIDEILPIVQKTKTMRHVLFKGHSPLLKTKTDLAALPRSVLYMPVLYFRTENQEVYSPDGAVYFLQSYLEALSPPAVEIVFDDDEHPIVLKETLQRIKEQKARVWINTLNSSLCGGHDDQNAIQNPDANWGWCIRRGANMFQTDEPKKLLAYLRSKNLHW
jgi:glycerophosphoryl diester phosphodiesterase